MKIKNLILLLPTLALAPWIGHAQPSEVPSFISYQGRVLDNNGNPVGSPTPVNRTIIFRVWDHPSNTLAGNLIYSEQQTVTISDGDFSVLIGQGVATAGTQFNFSETNKGPQGSPAVTIASAFGGANRYLGVTVDDGSAAVDNEITPRQQIVSSAFAFRAREAEKVISNAIDNTALASNSVASVNIQNNSVVTSKIATGAVTSAQIQDNGVTTADLANGSVTTSKLASNIGVWSVAGGGVFRSSGDVGIGGTPSARLSVTGPSGTFRVHPTFNAGLSTVLLANFDSQSSNGPQLRFSRTGNFIDIGTNGVGNFVVENSSDVNLITVTQDGRLGVGTFSPTTRMHVVDPGAQTGRLHIGGTGANGDAKLVTFGDSSIVYVGERGADDTMELGARRFYFNGGNVGIGIATPTRGALEVTRSQVTNLSGGFLLAPGAFTGVPPASSGNRSVSIYATNDIVAPTIRTISDERVKAVIGVSNSHDDLNTLMGIEITDYSYIDTVSQGSQQHKKLIAQQVRSVFPQAVTAATDVVPDIYRKTTMSGGWIELATGMKAGDRVRLITADSDSVVDVLEVAGDRFRTGLKGTEDVFVYGREVTDFLSVDYDAVAMLNISATQELKRAADAALAAIQQENARLEQLIAAQAERIAQLEALQQSTVSELSLRDARDRQRDAADQVRDARMNRIEAALEAAEALSASAMATLASSNAAQ